MAIETKWTPGPWEAREPNGKGMGWKAGPAWLGEKTWEAECEANARLIAAAQELYLELEMLCARIEGCGLEDLPPEVEAQISSSREALAKARGEA